MTKLDKGFYMLGNTMVMLSRYLPPRKGWVWASEHDMVGKRPCHGGFTDGNEALQAAAQTLKVPLQITPVANDDAMQRIGLLATQCKNA